MLRQHFFVSGGRRGDGTLPFECWFSEHGGYAYAELLRHLLTEKVKVSFKEEPEELTPRMDATT
jgi:hypothetical protein